jgi:hypothetical protein
MYFQLIDVRLHLIIKGVDDDGVETIQVDGMQGSK